MCLYSGQYNYNSYIKWVITIGIMKYIKIVYYYVIFCLHLKCQYNNISIEYGLLYFIT